METLFRPGLDDEDDSNLNLQKALRRLDGHITRSVAKVKADIDKYPHKTTATVYYASVIGIDPKNLRNIFRANYQLTVSEYRFQKRMERAITLLTAGKFSLQQIASKCGYSNVNNFSKAFRRTFNQTPINYLKSL